LSKHVSNSPGIDYNAAAQSPCTVFNLLRTSHPQDVLMYHIWSL